jgi:Domain of unknown function (DUF4286)
MIIYNVTCKIDTSREEEWVKWMREVHVPEVCAKGNFTSASLLKLKFPVEDEGVTYAIQYHCPSMQVLDRYLSEHAPALQLDHTMKFGTDIVAFRTILEKIGEYGQVAN